MDHLLHLAQLLDDLIIKPSTVHERLKIADERFPQLQVARHSARADPRAAFPRAPPLDVVVGHGVGALHERPLPSFGAQAQIHVEHVPLGGVLLHEHEGASDRLLGQGATPRVGVHEVGAHEHDVHIGAVIEGASAKLPHAEDAHVPSQLGITYLMAGDLKGHVQARLSHVRDARAALAHAAPLQDLKREQAQRLLALEHAQRARCVGVRLGQQLAQARV